MKIYKKSKFGGNKLKQMIEEEVGIVNRLGDHKNIVKVAAAEPEAILRAANGRESNVGFVAMEFVDSGELMDIILGIGPLDEPTARYFFKKIVAGMYHMHK